MARAMGVWAAIVLEAQAARTQTGQSTAAPNANVSGATNTPDADEVIWPAPIANEKPPAEYGLFLKHDAERRNVELGAGAFFLAGNEAHGVVGGSLFGIFEVSSGWFLRPSLLVGRTLREVSAQSDSYATLAATRFDACGRLPGYYRERRGIQLDLCGGADVGFLHVDSGSTNGAATAGQTLPIFALGPSLGLHGELGDLAAEVRAATGWNVSGAFSARGEVGLTWRLQ
jgi:hypothetical protein